MSQSETPVLATVAGGGSQTLAGVKMEPDPTSAPPSSSKEIKSQLTASLEEPAQATRQRPLPGSMAASPLPLRPAWGSPAAIPASQEQPPDHSVVTISDRRVRLPGPDDQDAPSLYGLTRAWVRNAPEIPIVQEPYVFRPSGRGWDEQVDGPRPAKPEPLKPPPLEPSEAGTPPAPEALLQHHLKHWKACRKQRQAEDRRLPQASIAYLSAMMEAGKASK